MKLLHLINLQGFGGAERIFIEYLKNSSFDNEILCTSNVINKHIASELSHFKINYANYIGSTSIKYPTFLRKLILNKKIKNRKADITIVWDFVPRLIRKPKGTTFIYYDHGCSWRYPLNSRTNNFMNMLDGAISISNASKRVMELRFSPSFEIKKVLNRLPISTVSHTKKIKNDKTIILGTASRLTDIKGIGIAILTTIEMLKKGIDTKLIIAGDGEQKKALKNLATNLKLDKNIDFIGYQSNMDDFYSDIDIYISTAITEPFGLSCIEALSHGIPVVYPLIDGQPEAIKNDFCGIGIKPTYLIDEYYKETGLNVDFPYEVYDPIYDRMTTPKLLNPTELAFAIIKVIATYDSLSKNALEWSKQTMDYNLFIKEFENSIKTISR
ncbi:glycosyltransferase [Xenorhabdus sp. XENO-10]|uniref:Glycosyltransferase n=1 Tax=Xenorhabdus yunnanensis TaxID=3025878 RepID=A0ABT5LJW9_9GAMM|nr:glycosyltransferase [Xenorhabdus yunnanensis]MDC9591409.1 glycosyltransferase [Xenorhabdus yunnanensis]